jgi:hypothetical protein
MYKKFTFGLIAMLLPLAGCASDPAPMYGHAETYDRKHIQFGDSDLEANTRIEPVTATRDPAGLLHVSVRIRNTGDLQRHVDAFITFYRDGQFLEKLGPQVIELKGNLFDDITFNSTQPASDYMVSLDYAK